MATQTVVDVTILVWNNERIRRRVTQARVALEKIYDAVSSTISPVNRESHRADMDNMRKNRAINLSRLLPRMVMTAAMSITENRVVRATAPVSPFVNGIMVINMANDAQRPT